MTNLNDYDFELPPELIANTPANPRDSARLFVYDTSIDMVAFDTFKNIGKFLPKNTLFVLNDSKVVPARLWLKKATGGKIEVLLMINELRPKDTLVKGITDRKVEVGAKLFFNSGDFLEIIKKEEQFYYFKPSVSFANLKLLLTKEGQTPIPPYIKDSPLTEKELRERYQSIFAHNGMSIAAPTASLHFTPRLERSLEKQGIEKAFVTLQVGVGTFAPINESNIEQKKLFTEYCSITSSQANIINRALAHGRIIIPVGTTALRTIESFSEPYHNNWRVAAGDKATDIFIFPRYDFKIAAGMITNFHVPRSSLLLLVDALLEHKKAKRRILELYRIAIKNNFRFYSFGDAMLIL